MGYWWLLLHLTSIIGFLLAIALVSQIVRERRSPAATWAWLLGFVSFPWVGVPAYLVFARRSDPPPCAVHPRPAPLPADVDEPVAAVDAFLRTHGLAPACRGNGVEINTSGEESYRALVELIASARHCIRVSMFILHPDEVGKEIIGLLAERALEGVEVRVLLDAFGSFMTSQRSLAPLVDAGGHVAFSGRVMRRPLSGRANQRNHRKLVVVDGQRALSGGINIASEYIGPNPRPDRWRDLSFVVCGPAARRIEAIFLSDWKLATGTELAQSAVEHAPGPSVDDALVQLLPSGRDVPGDPLYAAILSSIFSATRRLLIVTPYFVPDETLALALALAAERGVDVRVLVPEVSNHRMADLVRGTYLREIQEAGARVLLYSGGMVHAKAVVVDDSFAMIGSTNFDLRSLRLNFELSTLFYGAAEIRATQEWFDALAVDCREGVEEPGVFRDVLEGLIRVFAPLL